MKTQKMPKVEKPKYIRIKVVNKMQLIDEKDRTIYVREADGKLLAIQDGAEVVVSDHVYYALKDAEEPIYEHYKPDPTKDMRTSPAILRIRGYHKNVDITELSDWMNEREPKDKPVPADKIKEMLKGKIEAGATA
jgi:hypothetical protein